MKTHIWTTVLLLAIGFNAPASSAENVPEEKPFSFFVLQLRNGVEQFKGAKTSTAMGPIWDATIGFPGASDTVIQRDGGKSSFEAVYKRDSLSDAKATFDDLVSWAKRDLGDSWKLETAKRDSNGRLWWTATFTKLSERVKVEIRYSEPRGDRHRVNVSFEAQ